MVQAVTLREINRIFEVTDAMAIHREKLVIPLRAREGGGLRRMPDGRIEIVVDSVADFDEWLAGLRPRLEALAGEDGPAPA